MKVFAVVPVKPFTRAKRRLASCLPAGERATLARQMLHDTLQALVSTPRLAGCWVVSADLEACTLACDLGAKALTESRPLGLNAAAALGARHAQRLGADAVLVVPGDVPGLRPAELSALIKGHESLRAQEQRGALSLVSAHDGDGTNAWLLSPPHALAPAFGPGSFDRHQQLARDAGLALRCMSLPGLALDLDRVADLARFLADPGFAHTRTAAFLASHHTRIHRPLAEHQTA